MLNNHCGRYTVISTRESLGICALKKGIVENTLTVKDLVESECTFSALNSGYSLKVELLEEIKKWLGIVNSQFGSKITREKVSSVLKIFQKNKEKIHTVFELNVDRSKKFDVQTCIRLINKVFTKWGFSQVKKDGRKQKKVDGKLTDIASFNLTDITDMNVFKYIKARNARQNKLEYPRTFE